MVPVPAAPLLTDTCRSAVGSGTRKDVVTMLDEMRVHGARLRKAHGELHHSRRAYGVRVHPLDGGCSSPACPLPLQ